VAAEQICRQAVSGSQTASGLTALFHLLLGKAFSAEERLPLVGYLPELP